MAWCSLSLSRRNRRWILTGGVAAVAGQASVVEQRVRERNRLDKGVSASVGKSIKRNIRWLDKEIERLDLRGESNFALIALVGGTQRAKARQSVHSRWPRHGATGAVHLCLGSAPYRWRPTDFYQRLRERGGKVATIRWPASC